MAKTLIYIAKDLRNHLSPDERNIADDEQFKKIVRALVNEEYVNIEAARLVAGLFCLSKLVLLC